MLQNATNIESDVIVRPPCAKCGAETRLVRIEPDKPGYEHHVFGCPKCDHSQSSISKIG